MNEIKNTIKFVRENILKTTIYVACFTLVLMIASAVLFYFNTSDAETIIASFRDGTASGIIKDGKISFFLLLKNNIFACAICISLGIVPLLYLPVLSMMANGALVGALLGYGEAQTSMFAVKAVVFGLLPHGIIELPAFFLSMALGIYLCKIITDRLRRRAKVGIFHGLNEIARTFVIVVMPMLIVAALLECYVTPVIMKMGGM